MTKNRFVMEVYKKAAEELTKLKCLNFWACVEKWKAKAGKRSIDDGGIKESSQNKGDIIHQFQVLHTAETSCTCIWSESICVPVDTFSILDIVTVFKSDKNILSDQFHRNLGLNDLEEETCTNNNNQIISDDEDNMIISEEDEPDHNILTKQKYKGASIQLDNI